MNIVVIVFTLAFILVLTIVRRQSSRTLFNDSLIIVPIRNLRNRRECLSRCTTMYHKITKKPWYVSKITRHTGHVNSKHPLYIRANTPFEVLDNQCFYETDVLLVPHDTITVSAPSLCKFTMSEFRFYGIQ